MSHYVPSGELRFRPLDAPSSGIHIREYRNYCVHTMGHSDYIPSCILSTYDQAYFFLWVGHLFDKKMGHFCTSPWDLLSTYHRAFYVLVMGHTCSSRWDDFVTENFSLFYQSFNDHTLGHLCTCLISRSILMMILYGCLFYIFIKILSTFDGPPSRSPSIYYYLREQKNTPRLKCKHIQMNQWRRN